MRLASRLTALCHASSAAALLLCLLAPAPASAAWSDLGGGDHGGADWSPANGTRIAGVHTNVGTFTVAAGTTVLVQAFDGTAFGSVEVTATTIRIDGTLDGDARGYLGGSGGAGGGNS